MSLRKHPSVANWVLVDPAKVPPRLMDRATPVALLCLMDEEADELLERLPSEVLRPDDLELARLVAAAASRKVIARKLDLPMRTVDRRISALSARLGARSKGELAVVLARMGL